MESRLNWKPTQKGLSTIFNFQWKDISRAIDFSSSYNYSFGRQLVNHLENHVCITNKQNLFINLMKYCEKLGLDVFKYIPFTVIMNYSHKDFFAHFENFKHLYENIEKILLRYNINLVDMLISPLGGSTSIGNNKRRESIIKDNHNTNHLNDGYINNVANLNSSLSSFKRYSQKFSSSFVMMNNYNGERERLGTKTYCYINKTHYDNKNIWIVKACNLNRGRGLKVCDNLNDILNYITQLHIGINKMTYIKKENNNKTESVLSSSVDIIKNNNKYNTYSTKDNYIIKPSAINLNKVDGVEGNFNERDHYKDSKGFVSNNVNADRVSRKDDFVNSKMSELKSVKDEVQGVSLPKINTNSINLNCNNSTAIQETNSHEIEKTVIKNKDNTSKPSNILNTTSISLNPNSSINFNFLKPIDTYSLFNSNNSNSVTHSQLNNTNFLFNNNANNKNKKSISKSYDPKEYNKAVAKLNKQILRTSTSIIQKYIEKPLLYYGRKFDIRIWVLLTHKQELYAFKEGHLKVTSESFSLDCKNPYVHLTNYSIQKYNEKFSFYEIGNEVSYSSFQVSDIDISIYT